MKTIKLKNQPRWVTKINLMIGTVAGFILAFSLYPVGKTSAQSVDEVVVTHYTDSDISYVLNEGFPTERLFTGVGTITITDGETTITILDRNLGATAAGTGCEDGNLVGACYGEGEIDPTYGYHFQRGNNYGFKPCSDNYQCTDFPNNENTGGQITTSIVYKPFYIDPVFRIGEYYRLYDWNVVDLWGGTFRDADSSLDNRQVTNPTDRQGPCPENFHIPSYGEILKINDMFKNKAGGLHKELLIPFAGLRRYISASVISFGAEAYLWSSSPLPDSPASFDLIINLYDNIHIDYGIRGGGYSLRCIYDYYDVYQKPNVSDYIFEEKVDGVRTISICDPSITGATCITMMDRNLGAKNNNINSTGSYGYHYQWGSNYGFEIGCWENGCSDEVTLNATTHKAIWDSSYENHGYDGPISNFMKGEMYWSGGGNYGTLWGGDGDAVENNRGFDTLNHIVTNATGRQGPCPDEYHVPSIGEWSKLLEYWAANYTGAGNELTLNESTSFKLKQFADNTVAMKQFVQDFMVPSAGYRSNSGDVRDIGDLAYFWSSSPRASEQLIWSLSSILYYENGTMAIGRSDNRSQGFSVRCFKNTPLSFKYTVSLFYGENQQDFSVFDGVYFSDIINGNDALSEYANSNPGYSLVWYISGGNTSFDINNQPINEDLELVAGWVANQNTFTSTTAGGGGGGSHLRKDYCPGGDYSDSYYDGDCGSKPEDEVNSEADTTGHNPVNHNSANQGISYNTGLYNPNYSDEMNKAYQYAYYYGITTKDSIKEADVNGKLTRVAMAKMLSQYAINVLGMEPDKTSQNTFVDVSSKLNSDYDNGVTLAYQLGIMGINMPGNKFRPYDTVTRAEFVTALSRMKYGTEDGKDVYYSTHMNLLRDLGIITNTDPTLNETRGYVMLMLMRSGKGK